MQRVCRVTPEFGLMQVQQAFALCSIVRRFADTHLYLQKENCQMPGTTLLGLLSLMIQGGDELLISADGPQAQQLVQSVEGFLNGKPL